MTPERDQPGSEGHLLRLRRLCLSLPGAWEKLSHGEPTFFVGKKVFAMFANNHHNDGHIGVWTPAPPGFQEMAVSTWPRKFFRPPYVGARGWVGVELGQIDDEELSLHLLEAFKLTAPKKRRA